jgi:tetraacyldisaccharide 4'-kinase
MIPAEALYRVAILLRNLAWDRGWATAVRSAIPVISVGNLAVGGAGKTPFSAWLAARLRTRGERPAILHGGYAADEPALHRGWNPDIPVFEGRDRIESAAAAHRQGATVAILDDGFQHRRLARNFDIVLIAAETWTRTRSLLPRGPWREPAASLRRAGLVVVTRKSADSATARRVAAHLAALAPAVPQAVAAIEPAGWLATGPEMHPDLPCIAVAGIAAPASFLANARAAGAAVEHALIFGDHHAYTHADARRILAEAAGRGIVTTEKDAIKLHALLPHAPIRVLRQGVRIETGADILEQLLDRVRQ